MQTNLRPTAGQASEPEHWAIDVGNDEVAVLDIPGALRSRSFSIDVRFVVRCPSEGAAWHALSVELGGSQEWSRRIATNNPGQTDSLDFHKRVEVPAGEGLRVRALARAQGATPLQLRIDAVEQT